MTGGPDWAQPVPANVVGGHSFTHLVTGSFHTCGLSISGEAFCWGSNGAGQLGNGTTTDSSVPVAVGGGWRFSSLAGGQHHTCGLDPVTAKAFCWGHNGTTSPDPFGDPGGQLGNGTNTSASTPVEVSGGLTFRSIAAGGHQTCGVTVIGPAYCWGSNSGGQLGDGTTNARNVPVQVAGGHAFAVVRTGWFGTCGLREGSGDAWCWGRGQTNPTAVPGNRSFARLSVGVSHACAVTSSNAAWCWGENAYGALGDGGSYGGGTVDFRETPAAVAGGLGFADVAAGEHFSCALTTSGEAYCWGGNWAGQLGVGAATLDYANGTVTTRPVRVALQGVTPTATSILTPTATSIRAPTATSTSTPTATSPSTRTRTVTPSS